MNFSKIILAFCLALCSCKSAVDENYAVAKKVILTGHIVNLDSSVHEVSLSINRIGFKQEEIITSADGSGDFSFAFETYVPCDAWLTYQTNFLVLFHPGDSVHIQFDGSKTDRRSILKSAIYTGENVATTLQVSQFEELYYENFYSGWKKKDSAVKHLGPLGYKVFADSVRSERYKVYDTFITKYSPNEEAKGWAKRLLEDNYNSSLTWYPNEHREALQLKASEWDVPLSYYDYFEETEPVTNFSSSAAILGTTDRYVHRYIKGHALEAMPGLLALDPSKRDSAYFENILLLTPDAVQKEIAIAQYFSYRLSELSVEFFEKNAERIKQNLTHAFLREPLFEQYDKVKAEINSSLLNKGSLLNNIKINSDFLKEVIESHKGQPLFIDVWATWCGPCIEEFAYAKDLHDELTEVTFIYLCIESKEKLYLNALKKYQLLGDHYYLNDSQSEAIRKDLKIEGIPHYLVVNRAGDIVATGNDVRPSDDSVKTKIRKLISEL